MTARAGVRAPQMIFGVVLRELEQFRALVHHLAHSPLIAATEFTFAAPIFKGSDAIKQGLRDAQGGLQKFDVYFTHALLDEGERLRFARLFAAHYASRFPASERSDRFLASGEVLKFAFELLPPAATERAASIFQALAAAPHDAAVLEDLRAERPVEAAHLRGELKIFLDHVLNPRRHGLERVRQAARELGVSHPYVVELVTDGAVPRYFELALEPAVRHVDGRVVLLPG